MRFENAAREFLVRVEFGPLVEVGQLGTDAMLAVPSPDHFLPLLYVLGQHRDGDGICFPVEGFDGGSMSMLGVRIG
jgi:4,5-DOPA dioxygenase extradiol